jgi:hypothetical protein
VAPSQNNEYTRSSPRLLVLTPSIAVSQGLLEQLHNSSGRELLISCSLGAGQDELIQVLRSFAGWSQAFVFENTAAKQWGTNQFNGKWHQLLVDRICWNLEPFLQEEGRRTVVCHCEDPEMASVSWPAAAQIDPRKPDDPFVSCVEGESVSARWEEQQFEPSKEYIDWHHLRKRALVNGPHAITALLCYRLLAVRGMEPSQQFLAPIQHMIRTQKPQWEAAMSTYLRLRAIEVAWEHPAYQGNRSREFLHSVFRLCHQTAISATERFLATNDRLDRLMHPSRLGKEMSKFEEHILTPVQFYKQNRSAIISEWLYGRPNEYDILCLRDFLTESFIEATKWLTQVRLKTSRAESNA